MLIRKATSDDAKEIRRLLGQNSDVHFEGNPALFKKGGYKFTEDDIREVVKNDNTPVYVIDSEEVSEDNKSILYGYAFVEFIEYKNDKAFVDKKIVFVDDLCVDKKIRGSGGGRELIEYVKGVGLENGCSAFRINVYNFNERAKGFYEHMGFKPYRIGLEMEL